MSIYGYFPQMNLKNLCDRDICAKVITRSVTNTGWDIDAQIREEVGFTDGSNHSERHYQQTAKKLNTRFKRYFFARVDEFLAKGMNLNVIHPIANPVTKTEAKTGFHVEHILSWNDANKALLGGDEERFEQERNRLVGILLLKGIGKSCCSSSSESSGSRPPDR